MITTYPLLARDHEVLLAHEFYAAILDEAQAIKNPKATVSGLAHRINARHRFALTGTPIENNFGEVRSLFEFRSSSSATRGRFAAPSKFRSRSTAMPRPRHSCPGGSSPSSCAGPRRSGQGIAAED